MEAAAENYRHALEDFVRDYPVTYQRMLGAQAGYPRQTCGGGGRSGDVSDPTGEAALVPDQAAEDIHRVGTLVASMLAAARGLDELRRRYTAQRTDVRPCANSHGCPAGKPAAEGRTRCLGCTEYRRRHPGMDRVTAREVVNAVR